MEKKPTRALNYSPCFTMLFMVCGTMLLNDGSLMPFFPVTSLWPYTISMVIIFLTFTVVYLSLKLFKFPAISRQVLQPDEMQSRQVYYRWSALRMTSMMLLCLLASIAYLVTLSVSLWWCAVVVFVASWFCVSSEAKFQNIRQSQSKSNEE